MVNNASGGRNLKLVEPTCVPGVATFGIRGLLVLCNRIGEHFAIM